MESRVPAPPSLLLRLKPVLFPWAKELSNRVQSTFTPLSSFLNYDAAIVARGFSASPPLPLRTPKEMAYSVGTPHNKTFHIDTTLVGARFDCGKFPWLSNLLGWYLFPGRAVLSVKLSTMKYIATFLVGLALLAPSTSFAQYHPDPQINSLIGQLMELVEKLQAQLEILKEREAIDSYVREKMQEDKEREEAQRKYEEEARERWEALPICNNNLKPGSRCRMEGNSFCYYEVGGRGQFGAQCGG